MQNPYFRIDALELDRLRNEIKDRHPHASDSRKAILLANALWQQLSPFFQHMDKTMQQSLTLELFQRTLISNLPLQAEDINQICERYSPVQRDCHNRVDQDVPQTTETQIQTGSERVKLKRLEYALLILIFVLSSYLLLTFTQKPPIVTQRK